MAEPDDLLQQEVNVFMLCGRIGEHAPEEIDFGSKRLIANQNRAFLHHLAFDLRSHLQRREERKTIESEMSHLQWCYMLLNESTVMLCTDLMESCVSVLSRWQASQTGRSVPKTHITVLWLCER